MRKDLPIIMAVAQRPGGPYSKLATLVPLFYLDGDEVDQKDFPKAGLVFWPVSEPEAVAEFEPGTLVLGTVSKSSDAAPLLEEALTNLRTYFSELPDVELIAKIAGLPHTEPHSLPLFLAGLHALSDPDPLMPFPAGKLEYTGPWITWVGV